MEIIRGAQETLHRKEVEMEKMEERYKKHIEKAKMVLKSLDPNHNAGARSSPEVALLQSQIKEKDRLIERLERETEHHKALRETEDHLVTTAFYNLVTDKIRIRLCELQRQRYSASHLFSILGNATSTSSNGAAPRIQCCPRPTGSLYRS